MSARTLGRAGFSLVEVALALGIVAFVVVALIGLANMALKNIAESSKRIEAANATSQIVVRWRSFVERNALAGTVPPSSLPLDLPVPLTIPEPGQNLTAADVLINKEGNVETASAGQSFRVDYRIERPANRPGMIQLRLRLSWPPQAPTASAAGGSYEIVTGALLNSA